MGKLRSLFTEIDVNNDGKITWQEVGNFLRAQGQPWTEAQLKSFVAKADDDRKISIDELLYIFMYFRKRRHRV